MFPNAQDALPLPLRPNLEHYKKLARGLLDACKSNDPDAIGDWAEAWVRILVKRSGIKLGRREARDIAWWTKHVEAFAQRKLSNPDGPQCRVADVHFVIAQSHGFESWTGFTKHLKGLLQKSSLVAKFEAAADAICNGDIKKVRRLLRDEPRLIRSRSTRQHQATLLHYVSANGVEGYRQNTPTICCGVMAAYPNLSGTGLVKSHVALARNVEHVYSFWLLTGRNKKLYLHSVNVDPVCLADLSVGHFRFQDLFAADSHQLTDQGE